jgi:hypothetical protein
MRSGHRRRRRAPRARRTEVSPPRETQIVSTPARAAATPRNDHAGGASRAVADDVGESPELDRWQDHADADGPPADDVASLLRRGHPLAVRMFRVLEDRPDADVREVLLAAVALQAPGSSERVAAAFTAMAACLADCGSLARADYRRWRDEQELPDEWPTVREIEGTFRQWSTAVRFAASGGVQGAVTAARLLAPGDAYTREEMIACVRDWARTVRDGGLPLDAYRAWAREQMVSERRERSRYWRRRDLVWQHFGTWEALLTAAGYGDRVLADRPKLTETTERREMALFWLREAWEACSRNGWLTQAAFQEFAVERRDRLAADGQDGVWVPWPVHFHEMFGSWPAGLLAAGLIDDAELERWRGRRSRGRTDDELLVFVGQAMSDTGRGVELSSNGYTAWVAQRRAQGDQGPASYHTLQTRFGSWRRVVAAAADNGRSGRQAA